MAWYWYVTIYLVGCLAWWRGKYSYFVSNVLEKLEKNNDRVRNIKSRNPGYLISELPLTDRDRNEYAWNAAIEAVVWPILAIVVPAYLFVTRPTRAELEALRNQAEKLGLPFPKEMDKR